VENEKKELFVLRENEYGKESSNLHKKELRWLEVKTCLVIVTTA
jgi:hypothetical protein